MRELTKYFLLLHGLLETFIFSGTIFGWSALQNILLQIGVYQNLCQQANTNSSEFRDTSGDSIITSRENTPSLTQNKNNNPGASCNEQDRILNLVYTISSFCLGSAAIFWGYLLDKWGIRIVRMIVNVFITTAVFLLAIITKETSYLIFPSLILLSLAGLPLRMANIQIANLFPDHISTITTLYSGAYSASATVFVILKYLYDGGLPWNLTCGLLVILSFCMFPVTLFVLPKRKIASSTQKEEIFSITNNEISCISPYTFGRYVSFSDKSGLEKSFKTGGSNISGNKHQETENESYVRSIFSLSFFLNTYWFSWLLLYVTMYVGTLSSWIERASATPVEGVLVVEVYGILQLAGLFLAPLGGIVMDLTLRRSLKKVTDPKLRCRRAVQSCFWPMLITSLWAAVTQTCKFFDMESTIYVSIVTVTIVRGTFIAFATAYLRIRFQEKQFNLLLGLMSTTAGIVSLVQFPLFILESSSGGPVYVNLISSICMAIAFSHPFLVLFKLSI